MSGSYTQTPNLGLFKPTPNSDTGTWGIHLNANADVLDGTLSLTTGGNVTGPLLYTATGGTTARSAQDRAADEVNILDWGANNTGGDCTAALQAALATGKNVYMPAGTYVLTNQITVGNQTTAQGLRGDGLSTHIIINPTFNPSASSVILLVGTAEVAPFVRDLRLDFTQPNTVGNRASFVALGNPSATNGTAGVIYPPAILFGGTPTNGRFWLERLRIEKAWDGIHQITATGNSGGWWMRGIEMSAFNIGLKVGNNLDFSHITGWHAWPFNTTTSQQNVMYDGQYDAMQFGIGAQSQAINVHDVANFCGRIYIDNAGTGVQFSNLMLDNDNARIEVNNSQYVQVTNCYATCTQAGPSSGQPTFKVTNGKLSIISFTGWCGSQPLISVAGGRMNVINGMLQGTVNNVPVVQQSGGILRISNVEMYVPNSVAWTVPIVNCTGGTLIFTNNSIGVTSPGDVGAVAIAIDGTTHNVSGNNWNGWQWNPPATNLGLYGFNSGKTLPSLTVTGQSNLNGPVIVGTNAASPNTVLNGPASASRQILWQTAGSLRWAASLNNTETGTGNAGADFTIQGFSDTGGGLGFGQLFQITRSTGVTKPYALSIGNGGLALWGATPVATRPTVTGAKGSNAALASLLTALASYGLITDSTTA